MERLKILLTRQNFALFGLLFILLGLLATLTLVRQVQELRNRALGEGTLTFIDGAGNQLPGNPPTAASQNVGVKLTFGSGVIQNPTPTIPPNATATPTILPTATPFIQPTSPPTQPPTCSGFGAQCTSSQLCCSGLVCSGASFGTCITPASPTPTQAPTPTPTPNCGGFRAICGYSGYPPCCSQYICTLSHTCD